MCLQDEGSYAENMHKIGTSHQHLKCYKVIFDQDIQTHNFPFIYRS